MIALFAIATGCTALHTDIRKILDEPRHYEGRTVTIAGEVKSAKNLLVIRYFVVSDGTGEIPVVTKRDVPKSGDKVRVRGTVQQAFAIADKSLTVIEESAR